MKMHELNTGRNKKILMIHPMLSSAKGLEQCLITHLEDGYHYFLPDLAGHGHACKQTYKSASEEAFQIYNYLCKNNIFYLDLVFGASLGGVVLFELLRYDDIQVGKGFFEGCSFYENAHLLSFIMEKLLLHKHAQAVKNPHLPIEKLTKKYGVEAAHAMSNSFINISEESLKNINHDCFFVKLPILSKDVQSRCIFAYGEKDTDKKRASKIQAAKYPHSKFIVWDGFGHCEKMTADSRQYAHMLNQFIKQT